MPDDDGVGGWCSSGKASARITNIVLLPESVCRLLGAVGGVRR